MLRRTALRLYGKGGGSQGRSGGYGGGGGGSYSNNSVQYEDVEEEFLGGSRGSGGGRKGQSQKYGGDTYGTYGRDFQEGGKKRPTIPPRGKRMSWRNNESYLNIWGTRGKVTPELRLESRPNRELQEGEQFQAGEIMIRTLRAKMLSQMLYKHHLAISRGEEFTYEVPERVRDISEENENEEESKRYQNGPGIKIEGKKGQDSDIDYKITISRGEEVRTYEITAGEMYGFSLLGKMTFG